MDKLQWFKVSPSDWMMGKIQRCSEITQARFLRLCCLYWNKETNLTEEDARIEIDDEHFDLLLKKKIISSDDENIFIDFLDEQFDKILETSKKASKAGKASAAKRKASAKQKVNDRSTTVQQIPTDKIREDKKREEEIIFIKNDLFNSNQWKESITRIYNCKLIEVEKYLTIFLDEQEIDGNLNRELKEIKTHFRSWFKLQPFKKNISNEPHIPRIAL